LNLNCFVTKLIDFTIGIFMMNKNYERLITTIVGAAATIIQ